MSQPVQPDGYISAMFRGVFQATPIEKPLEYCEYTKNTDTETKSVYAGLATLSMISSVFIAWTIFHNKKLRQHPSSLIGLMAICEGISCFNALVWALNPLDYICYLRLHELFSWSMMG